VVDINTRPEVISIQHNNPGAVTVMPGDVGRNHAENGRDR